MKLRKNDIVEFRGEQYKVIWASKYSNSVELGKINEYYASKYVSEEDFNDVKFISRPKGKNGSSNKPKLTFNGLYSWAGIEPEWNVVNGDIILSVVGNFSYGYDEKEISFKIRYSSSQRDFYVSSSRFSYRKGFFPRWINPNEHKMLEMIQEEYPHLFDETQFPALELQSMFTAK